jgi:hypothetical protein
MKEKKYTLSVEIHVTKNGEDPSAKRWYSLKIYGHPINENLTSVEEIELSNMRDEQALKVGKKLLNAIWTLVEAKDGDYWKE